MASRVLPSDPFMPEPFNGNGETMIIDGEEVEIIAIRDNVLIVEKEGMTATWSKKRQCLAIPWQAKSAPLYRARTL